jgi:hypothetical protein
LFEKAVAHDPRFSSAQAMLALHVAFSSNQGSNVDPQKHASDVTAALAAYQEATRLDPQGTQVSWIENDIA